MVELKAYSPGDEKAILDLFERSFGRPLDPAFWSWRYLENPVAPPFIDLAWDAGRLAAHYAVCPVAAEVDGKPVLTALSMTTMTHPDYRGQGLFTRLAVRLYERLAAEGYGMVWGFPNSQSHRGFVKDLGWRDVAAIPTLRAEVPRAAPTGRSPVSKVERFDSRFDDLWGAWSKPRFAVRRDARYLTWRYARRPDVKYTTLAHEVAGALRGYVVMKPYREDAFDVVDLLALDATAFRALVGGAMDAARDAGRSRLTTWFPLHNPLHLELERAGFVVDAPVTYHGCRGLASGAFIEARDWHYSMGDSDVY